MHITKLRIKNYKGFKDSNLIEFGPGFNIIIGQNNAGKTAVLDTLRLGACEPKPHRNYLIPKDTPLNPRSEFEVNIVVTGKDLKNTLLARGRGGGMWIPVPQFDTADYLSKFWDQETIEFSLSTAFNEGFAARTYPSHSLFTPNDPKAVRVAVSNDLQRIDTGGIENAQADELPQLFNDLYARRIYVFKAERLGVGTVPAQESATLLPNAANLAAVLMHMQGNNPARYIRFNQHVTAIFPTIKQITIAPHGGNYDIRVWSAPLESEREDLAIRLEEGGTGIGQILAILYVAMTLPPSVIAIDEPNSFLHPGAVKKLIQILRQYPHQYILSTHSPELVSVAEPSTIHLVKSDGSESWVERISGTDVADLRRMLGEIGVALSDVFSSDAVVWVEGQTEQECFPLIFRHVKRRLPLGLSFLAVRNTGDFEAKDWRSKAIWELYERLTTANAILPAAIAFSFDREDRKEQEMEDLKKHSKGKVRFLSLRTYENYLLHPAAIATVLSDFLEGQEVTEDIVAQWIAANAGKYGGANADPNSQEWLKGCDAPRLLKDLFNDLSEARVEYRKTLHSVLITKWLLENDPEHLDELCEYVVSLVEPQT